MSDTPETDAALQKCWDANGEPYADHELESMVDFARRLERERDDARNLAAEIGLGITHSPDCSESIPCMRCQRDALREQSRKLRELADALLAELDRTNPEPETPQPDADGWIPHNGKKIPCDPELKVHVKADDGDTSENAYSAGFYQTFYDSWNWESGSELKIIAWKPAE